MEKTMVMKILEQKKIKYNAYYYDPVKLDAVYVAEVLNQDKDRVFKTLVTIGSKYYVFMIPSYKELDLKKAASMLGEKKIEMIKQKDLEPLTGYIHGGCSPIGMKKTFETVIHETAKNFDTIIFSGGKIGFPHRKRCAVGGKYSSPSSCDVCRLSPPRPVLYPEQE